MPGGEGGKSKNNLNGALDSRRILHPYFTMNLLIIIDSENFTKFHVLASLTLRFHLDRKIYNDTFQIYQCLHKSFNVNNEMHLRIKEHNRNL